jgi:rhodanese-related sulfurtransferase
MDVPLEISITEAARLCQSPGQAVLLDVREPLEWKFCHVEGSLHIPMGEIPGRLAELPRDRPILVLCHVGQRSMQVTRFLHASGYGLASNVAGGIDAWAERIDPAVARY